MKHLSRRDCIHAGCAVAAATLVPNFLDVAEARFPRGSSINARKMQLGLQGVNYFTGFSPFLNWWYAASAPGVFRVGGGQLNPDPNLWDSSNISGAPYFDSATGDVKMPFNADIGSISRVVFQGSGTSEVRAAILAAGGDYTAVEMTAYCNSQWTMTVGNCGTGGGVVSGNGTSLVKFTIGNGADASPLIQVVPVGTPTVAPSVKVCKSVYKSRLDAGEIFDPAWQAIVGPFGILRYMDWAGTNGSLLTDYSQIADASYQFWGTACSTAPGVSSTTGPLSGMPLSVICALANATGTEIHYCIPAKATDTCVQSIATYFKNNTTAVVTYEFSNECWNSQFAQYGYCQTQAATVPGTPFAGYSIFEQGSLWYGYRATAVMALIKAVYNDTSRWRGGMGTQSTNVAVTDLILTGSQYYITNVIGSGTIATYFKDLLVTSYMGPPLPWQWPTAVTIGATPTVTMAGHGRTVGQKIKFFVGSGMTQLNNVTATVLSVPDADHFTMSPGTTGFSGWVADTPNYFFNDGLVWQAMDDSLTNHNSFPGTYPTKYTYFNQQIAKAIQFGVNDMGWAVSADYSLAGQNHSTTGSWKLQKDRVVSNSLEHLRQYEGAPNFFAPGIIGPTTTPQYNEYFLNFVWSSEMAAVMTATYAAFATWGDRSSHFTEGGQIGVTNPWPGMRAVPQDTGNPGWQAVVNWNRG